MRFFPRDALSLKRVNFAKENLGVNDAPVANHRRRAFVHDAAGHLVQRELLVTCDNGMTCVRATCVAAHDIEVPGNEVSDLPFALVAPLGSHKHCCRHGISFLMAKSQTTSIPQQPTGTLRGYPPM